MSAMPASPTTLIVGSIAFDTLHIGGECHEKVLGGSATYAAISAAHFAPVQLVGVVGRDFPDSATRMLRDRKVDLAGLEVADGDTFHWEGRYSDDLSSRETLRTDLNVFADFRPKIPASFRDTPFVMLGNIDPTLQIEVLDQISAVTKALRAVAVELLDGHLSHCVSEALVEGGPTADENPFA